MNDQTEILADSGDHAGGDDVLCCDVSDAALEAAASIAAAGGAVSVPNAPTVSMLVHCCSIIGS